MRGTLLWGDSSRAGSSSGWGWKGGGCEHTLAAEGCGAQTSEAQGGQAALRVGQPLGSWESPQPGPQGPGDPGTPCLQGPEEASTLSRS